MSAGPTPESMFRVSGLDAPGTGAVLRMRTGEWQLDEDGVPCAGALGVLLDDAVGHQVFLARPDDGHASVTSELSLDFLVPASAVVGPELVATAWTGRRTAGGAHTQCEVVDGAGTVVAVASNWGRFVALPPGAPFWTHEELPEPDPVHRVSDLLGSRPTRTPDGAELRLTGDPRLANPMGMVHGGIVACAAERTAAAAADAPGWSTASLRVHYLRPTPLSPDVVCTATVLHRGRTVVVVRVVGGIEGGRPSTDATVTLRAPE